MIGASVVRLQLPYPISANRYWRTRIVKPKTAPAFVSTYVSSEAVAFKEQVGWLAKAAGVRTPIVGRIEIAYTLHPHLPQDWSTRARKDPNGWEDTVQCIDLDNANKVLLDALKGIVFEDDRWVRAITARRGEPLTGGAMQVQVRALPAVVTQPALDFPATA